MQRFDALACSFLGRQLDNCNALRLSVTILQDFGKLDLKPAIKIAVKKRVESAGSASTTRLTRARNETHFCPVLTNSIFQLLPVHVVIQVRHVNQAIRVRIEFAPDQGII